MLVSLHPSSIVLILPSQGDRLQPFFSLLHTFAWLPSRVICLLAHVILGFCELSRSAEPTSRTIFGARPLLTFSSLPPIVFVQLPFDSWLAIIDSGNSVVEELATILQQPIDHMVSEKFLNSDHQL